MNYITTHQKPPLSFPSVSGAVCSFDSQYAGLPLKSHTVDIDSVSGVSAINIANISDNTNISYFQGVLNGTYGFVDLGSLEWTYASSKFITTITDLVNSSGYNLPSPIVCAKYTVIPQMGQGSDVPDKSIYVQYNANQRVLVYDTAYTDAATFKTAMNGVYLIYELATPTTPSFTNAEFEALCEAFGMNGQSFTIQIGQTVNEATYNARTGVLEVTQPSVQTIQLPPCPIDTLEVNNIWADTGDTTLQYIKLG